MRKNVGGVVTDVQVMMSMRRWWRIGSLFESPLRLAQSFVYVYEGREEF